jgi:hypothetical protein
MRVWFFFLGLGARLREKNLRVCVPPRFIAPLANWDVGSQQCRALVTAGTGVETGTAFLAGSFECRWVWTCTQPVDGGLDVAARPISLPQGPVAVAAL